MDKRVISTQIQEEDQKIETSLRPQRLEEYIGQEKAKKTLKVYIEAAKQRGEALDHVLFYGPPGLGKTTLAGIIANEMDVHMKITSGPAIGKPGEMAAILGRDSAFYSLGSAAVYAGGSNYKGWTVICSAAGPFWRHAPSGIL